MNWIFWLILVIVLSFVEIATVNLVSIWFVASGIVAMILSFFIEDTAIITTIFILLGMLLLVISRPIVNKLRSKDNEKTNLDRIIGEDAIVTEEITKNEVGEVKVDGIIKCNAADEIAIILDVKGNMFLTDAITNEQVKYPFSIQIDEILEENDENYAKYFEKNQNILDIIEFLWENIVLEVPISYTNASGTHLSGQGWELNSKNEDDGLDPRFEKLNELFKGGE